MHERMGIRRLYQEMVRENDDNHRQQYRPKPDLTFQNERSRAMNILFDAKMTRGLLEQEFRDGNKKDGGVGSRRRQTEKGPAATTSTKPSPSQKLAPATINAYMPKNTRGRRQQQQQPKSPTKPSSKTSTSSTKSGNDPKYARGKITR